MTSGRLSRRLERLEEQAAAAATSSSRSVRILFVDPVEGLTSVLLLESDQPPVDVAPTPEEVESVRASLKPRPRYS